MSFKAADNHCVTVERFERQRDAYSFARGHRTGIHAADDDIVITILDTQTGASVDYRLPSYAQDLPRQYGPLGPWQVEASHERLRNETRDSASVVPLPPPARLRHDPAPDSLVNEPLNVEEFTELLSDLIDDGIEANRNTRRSEAETLSDTEIHILGKTQGGAMSSAQIRVRMANGQRWLVSVEAIP